MVPWSPSRQDALLGATHRVGKRHLRGKEVWEQTSTSGGLGMCKAVVSGGGIMARDGKEMASVVSAQLFLESAQLPPRDSRLFLHDSCTHRLPKVGVHQPLKEVTSSQRRDRDHNQQHSEGQRLEGRMQDAMPGFASHMSWDL